ncbi:hypothetical protein ATN00_07270 [Sphingobium baderi]|uniref:Uncharacterized protein n=1 Tax=Sphingobium baderi TaxID=1332080 RepID=A0A0S3EXK0_9SPHN|nr:hypothetical protein ATN00_07270 [Sphingobium baderi]
MGTISLRVRKDGTIHVSRHIPAPPFPFLASRDPGFATPGFDARIEAAFQILLLAHPLIARRSIQ